MSFETLVPAVAAKPLRQRLAHRGDQLPSGVRSEILALGPAVVPELIRLLDDDLATGSSPDDGWAPIHAAGLLIELKAPDAVDSLVAALVRADWEDYLRDLLIRRLPELGPLVLEPALSAMAQVTDPEDAEALCSVLSELGVNDERIFEHCAACFARNPGFGALLLADYGDVASTSASATGNRRVRHRPGRQPARPHRSRDLRRELRAHRGRAARRLGGSCRDPSSGVG